MNFWYRSTYKKPEYKSYSLLFLFLTMVSCELFIAKQPTREQLVKQEIQNINWNDLDRYPLFDSCDETVEKPIQKACFETTLTDHLKTAFQQHHIVVHQSVHDTVWINLHIDNQGKITILTIEKSDETTSELPQLDSIFKSSIAVLPSLYPPLKRDIPVAAKFKLPIVLHVE